MFARKCGKRLAKRANINDANGSDIISGCPVQSSPDFDDKGIAADPNRNNDFHFDRASQVACPLAAHIRKTNPREDLGPRGPNGVVNQFRILRRGIPYVGTLTSSSFELFADIYTYRATKSPPTRTVSAACSSSATRAPSPRVSRSCRASGRTIVTSSAREPGLTLFSASSARASRST